MKEASDIHGAGVHMPCTVVSTEIPYPLMWEKRGWLLLRLEGKGL